jgi:hypothetical protein
MPVAPNINWTGMGPNANVLPGGFGNDTSGSYPSWNIPSGDSGTNGLFTPGKGYSDYPQGKNAQNTMANMLSQLFLPFLNQQIGAQGPIGSSFMSMISQPGANFGQAQTAANSYANQLFKPGGQIASQISNARGSTISKGFAPSSAERSELGILNQGVSDVANVFGQGATQLEQQRMSLLGGAFNSTNQNIMDMIQSLFTGYGNIQQLGLAQKSTPKTGLLGLGFGPF